MKKKIKYIIFGIVYILAILILGAYFYKEGIAILYLSFASLIKISPIPPFTSSRGALVLKAQY